MDGSSTIHFPHLPSPRTITYNNTNNIVTTWVDALSITMSKNQEASVNNMKPTHDTVGDNADDDNTALVNSKKRSRSGQGNPDNNSKKHCGHDNVGDDKDNNHATSVANDNHPTVITFKSPHQHDKHVNHKNQSREHDNNDAVVVDSNQNSESSHLNKNSKAHHHQNVVQIDSPPSDFSSSLPFAQLAIQADAARAQAVADAEAVISSGTS